MHQIFLSHGHKDAPTAAKLVSALEATGARCWIAPRDLKPGVIWAEAIHRGLSESNLLMLLVSQRSARSDHVFREVTLADKMGIPINAVLLDDEALPPRLAYYIEPLQYEVAPERGRAQWLRAFARRVAASQSDTADRSPRTVGTDSTPAETERPEPVESEFGGKITRQTPGCIVILVDCSGSMNRRLGGDTRPRRIVVASYINSTLNQLARISRGDAGVRHYFDVSVLGYGLGDGGREIRNLLDDGPARLISIADIWDNPTSYTEEQIESRSGTKTVRRRVWIKPVANRRGKTVARAAFEQAYRLVDKWTPTHSASPPPIVLNITDGGYDADEDPEEIVRGIQELRTSKGNTLVFNCHLSDIRSTHQGHAEFPNDEDASDYPSARRRLFEQSSVLPEPMVRRAADHGYSLRPGARGYIYDSDSATLMDFLNIGTVPLPPSTTQQ